MSDVGNDKRALGQNYLAEPFRWIDSGRPRRQFEFSGAAKGPTITVDDPSDPLEILKTFITNEMIDSIVEYTNLYAILNNPRIQEALNNRRSGRTVYELWSPVFVDEIWVYITITFLMGIIQKPDYASNWSTNTIISTSIFSRLMRRDRFQQIRKMIYFSRPFTDSQDPLKKLTDFLAYLAVEIRDNYNPAQNICIDEYLSSWKGRLAFTVYIPNKRERYGIKLYEICESDSGYLLGYIIYTV